MKAENKGILLYVHIPFCLRKCRYCDFCSFDTLSGRERKRYLAALEEEIRAFPVRETVKSIFFGGGTPSLLSEEEAGTLLSLIRDKFMLTEDCEITLEANPASVGEEGLSAFRQLGFNRLSIGVQSFSDKSLLTLGRLHTAEEAERFFHMARRAGFTNINLDLMYATPYESREELLQTLETAIRLSPEHISAYGLILEEGTAFYRERDSIAFCNDDEEAELYRIVNQTLQKAGYRQYEISNYAKDGYLCRHNYGYWTGDLYLGFGVSAYSLYGGVRYGNTRDLALYTEHPTEAVAEREDMTPENAEYDHIMMALRTVRGISEDEFLHLFGHGFYEEKKAVIDRMIALGYMKYEDGFTHFTAEGFYLSSAILRLLLQKTY